MKEQNVKGHNEKTSPLITLPSSLFFSASLLSLPKCHRRWQAKDAGQLLDEDDDRRTEYKSIDQRPRENTVDKAQSQNAAREEGKK